MTRAWQRGESRRLERFGSILALAGTALLALHRWRQVGPYPPGLDGAQWLALGRGLHGFGRSTEGAYAPLVPILATITESIAGPLFAVRFLAALSSLAIGLAVWLVARDALSACWSLAVSAIVIPASALAEPVFFGGYPQQFAVAAGVLALWASCRYLVCVEDNILWLVGITAFVAASAHHVYFPIFALAILVATGLWLSNHRARASVTRAGVLLIALVPSFAMFVFLGFAFLQAGYAPPLGASAQSFVEAWRYGTRESPSLWFFILLIGVVSLVAEWRTRASVAWLLSASLLIPAGLLFLLSGQSRLLPAVLIGAGLAAGLGARRISTTGPPARVTSLFAATAVSVVLFIGANNASARFADFYRVIDDSVVQAAAAIDRDGGPGAVAVRQDHRGWPIGWWFEALLNQPVIVGSDLQWLAFPEEQEHARLAQALFDGQTDANTFRQRATSAGVRYLVILKWEWIGWERWLQDPDFPVSTLYDDDRYLVLRVT